jgi:hypothetical protein
MGLSFLLYKSSMNPLKLFFFAVVLLCLLPHTSVAQVSLVQDLIPGSKGSEVIPLARSQDGGLYLAALNNADKTDLFKISPTTNQLQKITTLDPAKLPAFSGTVGTVFTLPFGYPGAGSWYTDGTGSGTYRLGELLLQSAEAQVGAQLFFRDSSPGLPLAVIDLNSLTVRSIGGSVGRSWVLSGAPILFEMNRYFYQSVQDQTGRYQAELVEDLADFSITRGRVLKSVGSIIALGDTIYVPLTFEKWVLDHWEYSYEILKGRVSTLGFFSFQLESILVSIQSGLEYINADYVQHQGTTWLAYTLRNSTGSPSDSVLVQAVPPVAPRDSRWNSEGINTQFGNQAFWVRGTTLFYGSTPGSATKHSELHSNGEVVSARDLRILGNSLFIFGSTPSAGGELWQVSIDSCLQDSSKFIPGVCGCGTPDTDSDGDTVPNCIDGCANDVHKTAPGICGCGKSDLDSDQDGSADCADSCPLDQTKVAAGICGCGVADTDSDQDGTANCKDLCPNNAPKVAPGICGCAQLDTDRDRDGTADCADACPDSAIKTTAGACGCNTLDNDSDLDRIPDCIDLCPLDSTKSAPGNCGCGQRESDSDLDGIADCKDLCPQDPKKSQAGSCGCGTPDQDSDGDGTVDCRDSCPLDPAKVSAGVCGCGLAESDLDLDGVLDCRDGCPKDGLKLQPGLCGCGVADRDSDSDSVADCLDECPNNPRLQKALNGQCEIAPVIDLCPGDPLKYLPGVCGCGRADQDLNGDRIIDCRQVDLAAVKAAPRILKIQKRKTSALITLLLAEVPAQNFEILAIAVNSKPVRKVRVRATSNQANLSVARRYRWRLKYRVQYFDQAQNLLWSPWSNSAAAKS